MNPYESGAVIDMRDGAHAGASDAGIEREARELLAAECESYSGDLAQFVRSVKYGGDVPINSAIRATAAALRQRVSGGIELTRAPPAPVVDEAMVERGLAAARDASDARLPRYSVVRAILTAALGKGGE